MLMVTVHAPISNLQGLYACFKVQFHLFIALPTAEWKSENLLRHAEA